MTTATARRNATGLPVHWEVAWANLENCGVGSGELLSGARWLLVFLFIIAPCGPVMVHVLLVAVYAEPPTRGRVPCSIGIVTGEADNETAFISALAEIA